jgi:signal transduction histidine kinase
MRWKLRARRPRRWSDLRAPTIRLRLTLLYGAVFLVTGGVLLTIGYGLVRHNLGGPGGFGRALRKAGVLPPFPGILLGRPRLLFAPGSTDFRIAEAVRAQLRADELHRLLVEYALALLAMTMVSVAAGWLVAGRALRPLREITATARRVSGQNLGERIALAGPADELKELADTFDGMLGRLDSAFASQRHFVANASHELRTPLSIIRTEVDVALADERAQASELRRMGEAVRDTIDRCEGLIESLLTLARSEAAAGKEAAVDLAALAADCITDLGASARHADIHVRDALEPAWTLGDPGLLERMVANLVENGIRYNEPGGTLEIITGSSVGWVSLTVRNGGAVIDPGQARTLMEPFRRLERGSGGFGLGLSIVRSVAEAHGGSAQLIARAEGGLEVLIRLPAVPANVEPAQTPPVLTRS